MSLLGGLFKDKGSKKKKTGKKAKPAPAAEPEEEAAAEPAQAATPSPAAAASAPAEEPAPDLEEIQKQLKEIEEIIGPGDYDGMSGGQDDLVALEISLQEVLDLVPPSALRPGRSTPDSPSTVIVLIEDVFSQLSKGRVVTTLARLTSEVPETLLASDIEEHGDDLVALPLPLVVGAIKPEELQKRTQKEERDLGLHDIPNLFSREGEPVTAPPPAAEAPAPEPVAEEPIPEPVAEEPEPVVEEPVPEPVAAEPEPVVEEPVPEPEPVAEEPEPEPEPVVEEPEPEPEPVAEEPEPEPEPEPVIEEPEPEPVVEEPEPEPVVEEPEPEPVVEEPEPVVEEEVPEWVAEEPVPEPEPVVETPEPVEAVPPVSIPVPVQPAAEPEPVAAELTPVEEPLPVAPSAEPPPIEEGAYLFLHGIDLNKASAEEMVIRLDGVGPRLAQRMVRDRESNGPFFYLADLARVPGLGQKTFQHITGMEMRSGLFRYLPIVHRILGRAPRGVPDVRGVAARFAELEGFDGCILAHGDGYLLEGQWASDKSEALGAFAPQMYKKVGPYLKELDLGGIGSITFFLEDIPFTLVRSGDIYLIAVHTPSRFSRKHVQIAQAVGAEMGRRLSRTHMPGEESEDEFADDF